jgi:GNAT superfamily N-acetyltransferase
MEITLHQDNSCDTRFFYRTQFKIYHEPYLIWDREMWDDVLSMCDVFRIEADGKFAGDIIIEKRRGGTKYIVDFSLLPQYQGRGIGRIVLEHTKAMGKKIAAVTRKETLGFFLKSGFLVRRRMRNYYHPGVDGYYVVSQ